MHIAQFDRCVARRLRRVWFRQRFNGEQFFYGIELGACPAQDLAVAGHLQQRIDVAPRQQHRDDGGPEFPGPGVAAQQFVDP
ncbi:hypothetical protein D3C86_2016830 [compost metagenome]